MIEISRVLFFWIVVDYLYKSNSTKLHLFGFLIAIIHAIINIHYRKKYFQRKFGDLRFNIYLQKRQQQ